MRQIKIASGGLAGMLCCLAVGLYAAEVPPAPPVVDRKERLAELDRLKYDVWPERGRSKNITALEKIVVLQREVLGRSHPDVRASLIQLAGLYQEREDYPHAVEALREVAKIEEEVHGERHWRTSEARALLRLTERM